MMSRDSKWLLAVLLLALAAVPAVAQEEAPEPEAEAAKEEMKEEMAAAPAAGAYIGNLEFVGGRLVQLAEAIPAEKYGWRPGEGVRSVSEAFMHTAGANFFFSGRLGVAPPEGVDVRGLEEVTDKAKVVATLQQSLDHLKEALGGVEDLHKPADVFGREGTVEDLLLIAISHVHEHFGQLIAYARSNGVVPPWSAGG